MIYVLTHLQFLVPQILRLSTLQKPGKSKEAIGYDDGELRAGYRQYEVRAPSVEGGDRIIKKRKRDK